MKIRYKSFHWVFGLVLLAFLLSNCTNQQSHKQVPYLKVSVKILHDNQLQRSDLDMLIAILNSRIKAADCTAEINTVGDSLLDVKLFGEIDSVSARVIFSNGQLQFWELYSFSELAKKNCFVGLEKAFNESQSTTDQDRNNLSYYTNKKNLHDYIRFTVDHNGKIYNVGLIGAVFKKDTAFVKEFLESPAIKKIFPSDLVWMYGIPESVEENIKGYVPLYAVKTYGKTKSIIENDAVSWAKTDFNIDDGMLELDLAMTKSGAKSLEEMTGKNIKKFITLTIDNLVYASLKVVDTIKNGKCIISGGFSINDISKVETILNGGRPPALMSVLSIKEISKE